MPGSKKVAANRARAENIANGVGDETGRIPVRVKAEKPAVKCALCFQEFLITKTCTEIKVHVANKHAGSTHAQCFAGVELP